VVWVFARNAQLVDGACAGGRDNICDHSVAAAAALAAAAAARRGITTRHGARFLNALFAP